MRKLKWEDAVLAFFTVLAFSSFLNASSITQTFTLHPGWNAIFLEVEPNSTSPADIFSGIGALESVWMWNPRTGTVEFIDDPNDLVPEQPQWLVYIPRNQVASNLHAIHGNTAYLIKLGGNSDVTLSIDGEPLVPSIKWKANSFNFVGFHLKEGEQPSFSAFFSSSPAHAGQPIFVLDNGHWAEISDPTNEKMKKGVAFWIYCKGSSVFTGPVSVQLDQGKALDYGAILSEQDLWVINDSDEEKHINLSVSDGTVNLHYWMFQPQNNIAKWIEMDRYPLTITVKPHEKQRLRLGVKRKDMDPGSVYKANLIVNDGGGSEILVPVSVKGVSYAGLWVGNVTVNKVNEPANNSDPDTPVKTGSEFSFRLILHIDESGNVRLLPEVIQMWQEGTWKPDPDDPGKLVVDEPGHFVLLANDALIPNYSGSAMRDGQLVGRRISAPVFPRIPYDQTLMTGNFDPYSGTLERTITLDCEDPTNPFRHKFHPDHKTAEKSYEVTRVITLNFRETDSDGKLITGVPTLTWGSTEIGGIYTEDITGLHKNTLHVKGTFYLRKVSRVSQLQH